MVLDNNSKFGTLVLVRNPILISDIPKCLQIGRTYVEASTLNTNSDLYINLKKSKDLGL